MDPSGNPAPGSQPPDLRVPIQSPGSRENSVLFPSFRILLELKVTLAGTEIYAPIEPPHPKGSKGQIREQKKNADGYC